VSHSPKISRDSFQNTSNPLRRMGTGSVLEKGGGGLARRSQGSQGKLGKVAEIAPQIASTLAEKSR